MQRNQKEGKRCVMDLISRQAAIDRINKQREHLRPDIYSQDKIGDAAYRICAEFIKRLPPAQPERKTGRWVDAYRSKWDGTRYWFRQCDQCLYERDDCDSEKDTKFCPNCGAAMERSEECQS